MNIDSKTLVRETKHLSTFAVLFYIDRTKVHKDGMCQLLCKVSIDAELEQIGTKVSVNPAIWNPEKGRADGRSESAVKGIGQKPLTLLALFREHNEEFKKRVGVDREQWSYESCTR